MAPTHSSSPVPFASETCRSPTWDEYLANSSNDFSFPTTVNLGDQMPRETRPSTSTSSGPSQSYSGYHPAPLQYQLSSNQKRKVSQSPQVMTFPLSIRPEMKTVTVKKSPKGEIPPGTQIGRWTKREHELFLEGLQRYGKSWKKISSLVHTRTLVQIRTHAQKYLQKQSRAAVKADAKAAEAAARESPIPKTQQQGRTQQQPPCLQMNAPRVFGNDHQWKSPLSGDRSGFAPVAFPSSLSASTGSSASRTQMTGSSTSSRSGFQLNSVNGLDQLLQDDNTIPAFVDEYYTSPTAIEDDLLGPLYTSEQWIPRLAHPAASVNYSNKRRRLETSTSACASAPTGITVTVPTLRPALPSTVVEPLPAPDNLSSPSTSPSSYGQRQSALVLLAAHETDETTNYTNAWL